MTLLGIAVAIVTLSALPGQAFLAEALKGLNIITQLIQQKDLLESQFTNPQNLFFWTQDLEGNAVSVDANGNFSLKNAQGKSITLDFGKGGLPDIGKLIEQIFEYANDSKQYDEADEAANHAVREVTRAKAEGTLSEEGQQAVSDRLEAASETTEATGQLGEEAQTEFVTQNVLKKIAQQNSYMATLSGSLNAEIVDLSTKQDLANQNLTNISQGIDSENLSRQGESEGSAISVLQLTSMMGMR